MELFRRKVRNRYLFFGDIFLTLVSVLLSYMVRLELIAIFPTYQSSLLWMLGAAVLIKPLVYFFFGIYSHIWRYASTRELILILSAVSTASILLSGIMVGLFAAVCFLDFPVQC
jgi:FlaA1/EpsC-like NDP-sugar epimerase